MTVSTRNARPSFKYCLMRECLEKQLTVTSTPRVTTRVAKPLSVSLGMRRSKISEISSGRPMPRLSATSAWKNARARRGWSSTRVGETSIWRIDSSHQ
jgi:hypothetical protein